MTMEIENKPERFIRLPEVKHRTDLARSTVYHRMSLGTFPRNRNLDGRCVGWVESEIDGWIKNRVERGQ